MPDNKHFDDTLDIPAILKDREVEYAIYIGDRLSERGRMLYSSLFYQYAIDHYTNKYGKYSKDIIDLYFKQSNSLRFIGKIDESYNLLNTSLIATLLNYSYNSAQLINCLFNYSYFAKFIGEDLEYVIYNEEVEFLLPKVRAKVGEKNFLLLYLKYANGLIQIGKEREYQYMKKIMKIEAFVKQLIKDNNLIAETKGKNLVLKKTDNIEFIYFVYYRLLIEMTSVKKEDLYNILDKQNLKLWFFPR